MVENIEKKYVLETDNFSKPSFRSCDWPSCGLEGIHRAPKSKKRIREYCWFCLEHVRIYNSSWNYYEDMSDEEVDALVRSDTTWNRPTWPLGESQRRGVLNNDDTNVGFERFGMDYANLNDPFSFFSEGKAFKRPPLQVSNNSLSPKEKKALAILGFDILMKTSEIKARYKLLVKKYHPDSTGGNKMLEERFKQINEAYELIMRRLKDN